MFVRLGLAFNNKYKVGHGGSGHYELRTTDPAMTALTGSLKQARHCLGPRALLINPAIRVGIIPRLPQPAPDKLFSVTRSFAMAED